jgi:hypothetical protein
MGNGITLASSPVYANNLPITPDGSTNTIIEEAANNVPIVNIAAPNSGGLSHNRFTNYNVNEAGLLINNATGNTDQIVQTNLAGLIIDNPNIKDHTIKNRIYKTLPELENKVCKFIRTLNPEIIRSVCGVSYL